MISTGPKVSRKRREAIEALLEQPSIGEAARVVGVSPQTLRRWQKEPAFDADYRAAKRAHVNQAMVRLRQGAVAAVKSVLNTMYNGKNPGLRLKAAQTVISLGNDAIEIDNLAAALAEVERDSNARAKAGSPHAGQNVKSPGTGHGAKFPRLKEQAIAALLEHRSVALAARAVGIGTQTLYRWLADPAFVAEYAASARAVWGCATMCVPRRMNDAATTIRKLSADPTVSEATRLRASLYILNNTKADEMEALAASVAKLEPATNSETRATSTRIATNLYQRVARLKASLLQEKERDEDTVTFIAADGRATSRLKWGPDGRQIWTDLSEGCNVGELLNKQDVHLPDKPV